MKLVFITSTGGAVLDKIFEHKVVRENTFCVVSDRECGALLKAKNKNVFTKLLSSKDGLEFSIKLNKQFSEKNFIYISFYTKLLTNEFLDARKGFVFNCHPSVLPACKGLNGFDDTLNSNSLFVGCTLHEVNLDLDSGRSVIQCALPLDRSLEEAVNRHKVFLMQYYSTLQFIKWIVEGNFTPGENWHLNQSHFNESAFSPNLDKDFLKFFDVRYEL
jgi:phosphoribosylglycinamide formyltransferase-1